MSDDPSDVAHHVVQYMRCEWEYESDRKEAIAYVTRALREFYAKGKADGQREEAS